MCWIDRQTNDWLDETSFEHQERMAQPVYDDYDEDDYWDSVVVLEI